MAEQTNNLVDRLVRILSKKGNDFFDYSTLGKIKVYSHSEEGIRQKEFNTFLYDPASIKSFLDAYEDAVKTHSVNRFIYIGVYEMFQSRRYK